MAVRNVSNIRQFIAAIEQCQANDVIEVLADLDWNEVVDEITTSVKLSAGTTISGVTINGNNHTIYNMTGGRISQSGSGVNLFNFGSSTNITINGLSFLNCQMGSRSTNIIYGSGTTTVFNAVIQGKFKSAMFNGTGMTVRDSMITASLVTNGTPLANGSANATPKWKNCWIRLDNCEYTYASSSARYAYNLDGCYVEGTIGFQSAPNTPNVFGNVNNSCINVAVFIQVPTPETFCTPTSGETGQSVNIINIDKIVSPTPLTENDSTTWVKCVTDEHMKNAEYLASIGFDIIP
ncbi:MAG: hypothetical protein II453_21260 [Alphaproteobacteria bacterium]|nr:hypothetical protein [Alphaproteobacteria bacterium]MBQ3944668.1 hypothetical protein [Alphaproteobacteria bacterium]